MYAIAEAVLMRSFPVKDEAALVNVASYMPKVKGFPYGYMSALDAAEFTAQKELFSAWALWMTTHVAWNDGAKAQRVRAQVVTPGYFEMLGVRAARGRLFAAEDTGGLAVATEELCGDCMGRTVRINGHPFQVIGIVPREFRGLTLHIRAQLWALVDMHRVVLPTKTDTDPTARRDLRWFQLTARLKPAVSQQRAEQALRATAAELHRAYPQTNRDVSVAVMPLSEWRFSPFWRAGILRTLTVAGLLAGLLLLMSCTNVAGLILARAAEMREEVAVRTALGALRRTIVLDMLGETLVLGILGTLAGWLMARLSLNWFAAGQSALAGRMPVDVVLDLRMLGLMALLGVASILFAGLPAAIAATRGDLGTVLKNRSRVGSGATALRMAAVATQVALSCVLLFGAGLLVMSLRKQAQADPGFRFDRVVMADIDVSLNHYSHDKGRIYYDTLLERVRALPGVAAAGFATSRPLQLQQTAERVYVRGKEISPEGRNWTTGNIVTPGYFDTIGLPILRGRALTEEDREGRPLVIVINEAMAKEYFPGEDALGKTVKLRSDPTDRVIVGIARDAKYRSIVEVSQPYFYQPWRQKYVGNLTVMARTTGDPDLLKMPLQKLLREMDADLPAFGMATMREQKSEDTAQARQLAGLASFGGGMAVLLAAVGLFGTMVRHVEKRRREIGLRMAVGAARPQVIGWVLKYAARIGLAGALAGVPACVGMARVLQTILFEVQVGDLRVSLAVGVVVALVVVGAAWIPARRAAAVDPAVALRSE